MRRSSLNLRTVISIKNLDTVEVYFLFPAFAVEVFVDLAEVFVGHVGVHLRCLDVGVTKECLH